jgi:hypothetical protein
MRVHDDRATLVDPNPKTLHACGLARTTKRDVGDIESTRRAAPLC